MRFGIILNYDIAAANIDERGMLPELTQHYQGMLIADKGLIRPALTQELAEHQLDLQTPLKSNMKDNRPKAFIARIMNIRRTIETVIGQRVERFRIQSIRAKNLWNLQAKIARKILAHTVGFFLSRSIQFENMLT